MFNLTMMMILMMLISMMLVIINFLISKKKYNSREKSSPFECGFDPLSPSRLPFSIQFYTIGLIFLIFDVEIIIFFPMISSFMYSSIESNMIILMLFVLILIFGLYIEWNDGALKWLL